MPLCFQCHAEIGHYNKTHPIGRSYRIEELKARRNQVYDKYTSHLVPPVQYQLTQQGDRKLPDVGCWIQNLGDIYPVQARIKITLAQGTSYRQLVPSKHYDGTHLWNLNPRQGICGHFPIPPEILDSSERLRAKIDLTLVDIYQREHVLLPMGQIHGLKPDDQWYAEPSMVELAI